MRISAQVPAVVVEGVKRFWDIRSATILGTCHTLAVQSRALYNKRSTDTDESSHEEPESDHHNLEILGDGIEVASNPTIDGTKTRNELLHQINATSNDAGVEYKRVDGQATELAYNLSDDGMRTRRP